MTRMIKDIDTGTTVWEEAGATEEEGRVIIEIRTIDAMAGDIKVNIARIVAVEVVVVELAAKVSAVWIVVALLVATKARPKITKRAKSSHQKMQHSDTHERPCFLCGLL